MSLDWTQALGATGRPQNVLICKKANGAIKPHAAAMRTGFLSNPETFPGWDTSAGLSTCIDCTKLWGFKCWEEGLWRTI